MGQALSVSTRRAILSGYSASESFASISTRLGVSYSSVRRLCKRYDRDGESCLVPGYDRCGQRVSPYSGFIHRASCFLKFYHRGWGAEYILVRLRLKYPNLALPDARTLQRWFVAKGLNKSRSKARDRSSDTEPIPKAEAVHQIWQIDANERHQTLDGQGCCYLSFTDEYSGAGLGAAVFPPQANLSGSRARSLGANG